MSSWKASAVGYFLRTIASSSSSVYSPRGRKPLYQTSKGSSGRPRRPLDERGDLRDERRGEDLLEHRPDARLGDLAVLVEAARDQRRRRRRVRIGLAGGLEGLQEHRVARVRLRRVGGLHVRGGGPVGVALERDLDRVGDRVPVDVRVVDDGRGDRLRDDALHDLRDQALLGEAVPAVRVVGLDLVAQVPVRQQAHASAGRGAAPSRRRDGASRCCTGRCSGRPRRRPRRSRG